MAELRRGTESRDGPGLTCVLHGLGGAGKTQVAVEYCYRVANAFDVVWWIRAETPASLVGDYASLAERLHLVPDGERDQQVAVGAVRDWLNRHGRWLLVFDNAAGPEHVRAYLPQASTGAVLITSRNPDWRNLARRLRVGPLAESDAVRFLLDRTGQTAEDEALALAGELGCLPLALEQAGAYMDATGTGIAEYLTLFRTRRGELWKRERGPHSHPEPVEATWSLALEGARNAAPAGIGLLNLCAYLAPDGIPLPLLAAAAADLPKSLALALDDPLQMNEAVAGLRRYSLVDGGAEALSVHRLVQAVVRDQMGDVARTTWLEACLMLLDGSFPQSGDVSTWSTCARLLPHVLVATDHAEGFSVAAEMRARLMSNAVSYLSSRARYGEAEPLCRRALGLAETTHGPDHEAVATTLNRLALLCRRRGQCQDAEPLYLRALETRERLHGPGHPEVAQSLNNLAALYYEEGRYADAKPLQRRALDIRVEALGSEHQDVATAMNVLAALHYRLGEYDEAEPLYRHALSIREKCLGPEHPDVSTSLNNLALLYRARGEPGEAEPLLRRALGIREKVLGPEHPAVAQTLNNLASVCRTLGKQSEAEVLYQRAIRIDEASLGEAHPNLAQSLGNLALLCCEQRRNEEAEELLVRALAILEERYGPDHPRLTKFLCGLARVYAEQDRTADAERLFERALRIAEVKFGPGHLAVAEVLEDMAEVWERFGDEERARTATARARAIRD